jgi:hypothetical protein
MQRDHALDFTLPEGRHRLGPSLVEARLEDLERDRNAERGPSKATVRRDRFLFPGSASARSEM